MGTQSSDEDDATVFMNVEGTGVMSRAAFQLHSFAMINSIRDGRPGFVGDDYLNGITAETTITAMELVSCGAWERREGGYFIVADDMLKIAIDQHERMDELARECESRGAHLPDKPSRSGWVVCDNCGVPLERPDGGPVALPNGGRLGPDIRDH